MSEIITVDDYKSAQAEEWGQYVAAKPIHLDGSLAFNTGDPVPASHVTRGVVSVDDVTVKKG